MLNSWALAFLIFILLRVALLRSAKVTHVSLLNRVTARFFFFVHLYGSLDGVFCE